MTTIAYPPWWPDPTDEEEGDAPQQEPSTPTVAPGGGSRFPGGPGPVDIPFPGPAGPGEGEGGTGDWPGPGGGGGSGGGGTTAGPGPVWPPGGPFGPDGPDIPEPGTPTGGGGSDDQFNPYEFNFPDPVSIPGGPGAPSPTAGSPYGFNFSEAPQPGEGPATPDLGPLFGSQGGGGGGQRGTQAPPGMDSLGGPGPAFPESGGGGIPNIPGMTAGGEPRGSGGASPERGRGGIPDIPGMGAGGEPRGSGGGASRRGPGGVGGGGAPTLTGFARNALANPSRFDTGLVKDISKAIDFELGRKRESAYNTLDERMAQRGLTGSNVEADMGRRVASDIENQRRRRLTDLEMELARTAAQDRATAANIGMGVNQQRFGQGMERARFGEGQRQFDFGAKLRSRAQELQRQGMEADEAFRQAQTEFNQAMQGAQFGEGQRRFDVRSKIDQRAQQLRQQGMKADEAFRRAQLEVENELRNRGFDIEEELARNDQRMQALQLLLQAMASGDALGDDFLDALGE